MSATMEQELEEVFAALKPEEQREVLEFARALQEGEDDEDEGARKRYLHLMGCVCEDDLRQMVEAVRDDNLVGVILVRFMGPVTPPDSEFAEDAGEAAADPAEAAA